MKSLIHKLLREYLNEVQFTGHPLDRIKERFDSFNDDDIPPHVKQKILNNLDLLGKTNFPKDKSYAIMLGQTPINPKSKYYYNVAGRGYYRVHDEYIQDSTGDQFWVIVRGNVAYTFMLRKAIQTVNLTKNSMTQKVGQSIKDLASIVNKKEAPTNKLKYLKLRLTDGSIVKYYNNIHKFEDMNGNTISIDNIFDILPEEIQDEVLSAI